MKKMIDEIKKEDTRARDYVQTLDNQSAKIRQWFNQLGTINDTFEDEYERLEMFNLLNSNLEETNKLNKEMRQEYLEYMSNINADMERLSREKPGLFQKFIEGNLDDAVLLHALDTYTMLENNQVDEEEAKQMGYYKYHKTEGGDE